MSQKPNIKVGVLDHLDPIARAMAMAKYSRDYGPIEGWMPKNEEEVASFHKRFERYYVNYAHKSVGQLGSTDAVLEGVSQLAAKAIEDVTLFNGQESSTRYIDFSTQPFIVPQDADERTRNRVEEIQEDLRNIYIEAVPLVREAVGEANPCLLLAIPTDQLTDEDKAEILKWTNAINARTFDICRSILPAGCATNVGFLGTFDLMNDHFGKMLHHPLQEMRDAAEEVLLALEAKYPKATPGVAVQRDRFGYMSGRRKGYFGAYDVQRVRCDDEHTAVLKKMIHDTGCDAVITAELARRPLTLGEGRIHWRRIRDYFLSRNKWEAVPRDIASLVNVNIQGFLDFGSFRDLQRHRNGVCLMPLLSVDNGATINKWYTSQLPASINAKLDDVLSRLRELSFTANKMAIQYAIPMGVDVQVDYTCNLDQLCYLTELRSGGTVHQTLRNFTNGYYNHMVDHGKDFGFQASIWENIFPDQSLDKLSLKRGEQNFGDLYN